MQISLVSHVHVHNSFSLVGEIIQIPNDPWQFITKDRTHVCLSHRVLSIIGSNYWAKQSIITFNVMILNIRYIYKVILKNRRIW